MNQQWDRQKKRMWNRIAKPPDGRLDDVTEEKNEFANERETVVKECEWVWY